MQKNVYLKISEACYTGNVSKPKKKHRSDQWATGDARGWSA
jgi:hypothetical protein